MLFSISEKQSSKTVPKMLILFSIFLCLVAGLIYFKLMRPLNYWEKRNIISKKPCPIVGNMFSMICQNRPFVKLIDNFYNYFPNERYCGVYLCTLPVLIIRDLDLIKKITIKNFDHFTDRARLIPKSTIPLMDKNRLSLLGKYWREKRVTFSPSFTSSKIKAMFHLLCHCSEQFTQHFANQENEIVVMEMKDIFTRFANDAIASIAFGFQCNSLGDQSNEFYKMRTKSSISFFIRKFQFYVSLICPLLNDFISNCLYSQRIGKYFYQIVKNSIQQRQTTKFVRPDLIHLMLEARKDRLKHGNGNDGITEAGFATVEESDLGKAPLQQKLKLSDDDIVAQALIFFTAGFEPSSTLMSFAAYELAVNPDIQKRLQLEIDETLSFCNGNLTYELLMKMKYMDMVISETLRKWPPGFQYNRICVQDYVIPPKNPDEKETIIKKGEIVLIPVYGIHHDAELYPNPELFDPERFSDENKSKILPYSYMPFGSGPRSCIASRLALLESKILFFHILANFDILVVNKTQVPLEVGSNSLNMLPDGGYWLGFHKRKASQG